MALRDYAGNATPSTLVSGITNVALALDIPPADATTWPTGGANGKFFITIDRGLPSEERLLATSQAGGSITIAAIGDRGVDGTTAVAHSAGATVEHTYASIDAEEANAHINNAAADHHTQYMMTSGTRHDLTARHSAGSVVPTAVPVAIGTAIAEGGGSTLARAAHVHTIGTGAINAAGMFAAGIVDLAAIGAAAVGTAELVDLNVTAAKIADLTITNEKIANTVITAAKFAASIFGASAQSVGLANSAGVATSLSRSDHVHDQIYTEMRRDEGAGSGALTTSFVSQGATLSLPAGTWMILGKWRSNNSTASRETHAARIQNTTDASTLDEADVSIDAAAADNIGQIVVFDTVTIAGTKTFDLQAKTLATGGTQLGSTCLLMAMKVTEII